MSDIKKSLNQGSKKSYQKIYRFLIVIFSAVALALGFSFWSVWYYAKTDNYLLKNILIAPDVLDHISYQSFNPKIGGNTRYIFKRVVVNYFDDNRWQEKTLERDQYRRLYKLIAQDESLSLKESKKAQQAFIKRPLQIFIMTRSKGYSVLKEDIKIFQKLQVSKEGNYFRVLIPKEFSHKDAFYRKNMSPWIYFHHSKIYDKIQKILEE